MRIVQIEFPHSAKEEEKVYFCNNSLLHYQDDLFLMTFRRMEYHIPNKRYLSLIHPWKMWDNGFKFLHPDPDRIDPRKEYGKKKFRQHLSADLFINFQTDDTHLFSDYNEFDSTGMAILHYDPTKTHPFRIVHLMDNIFGRDMNQDCRIFRDRHGDIWLLYNGYFLPNECRMLRRKVHLNLERQFMYLYEEEEVIPASIRRPIEKNCIMDGDTIYYGFHKGSFTVIRDGTLHRHAVPFLQEMVDRYEDRFVISLGTPPTRIWDDRHVAVGHVKIEFRNRLSCLGLSMFRDVFQDFLEGIRWEDIYMHGKYIYFMFFFEFNADYKITRISNCFIPTQAQRHLPYLLTFPCGFTADPERYNFWLSYGEGDVRCKILTMTRDDIDNLLLYPEVLTHAGYKIHLLDIDEWNARPRIFHVGYFFEKNCGDDMFRVVFQSLRNQYYPSHLAIFRNHYKHDPEFRADRDLLVFGGGDIVNRYFLNERFQTDGITKDAVSIGIPYIDDQHLLDHFRFLCLRSLTDYRRFLLEGKDADRLCYFPDLGFLMPRILSLSRVQFQHEWVSDRPRLGVCLARTFYRTGNETEYIAFILSLVATFQVLLEHMDIYLIPFCTNRKKRYEDDHVINRHILEFFREDPRVVDTSAWPIENDEVFRTYALLDKMDFLFCSRFHSHIFSICLKKPFVSFSQNRKVMNVMKEFHLEECVYPFENIEGLPVRLDPNHLARFVLHHFHRRHALADRLAEVMKVISLNMDRFITMWETYIRTHRMIPHPIEPVPETTSS